MDMDTNYLDTLRYMFPDNLNFMEDTIINKS